MKLKCLVVDDEPLAREILVQYISDCPSLELVAECSDALAAGDYLRDHPADLIFLDVNMPRLSGTRFVKTLTQPLLVIFTTAYPEFAAEGFESNAVDYLLKPISFERFIRAVNKAAEWAEFRKKKDQEASGSDNSDRDFILLRADKRIHKVNFDDILFFESTGDYIRVHCKDKTLVIHETFRNLMTQIPENLFIRVHKSFIVSFNRIRLIDGNQVDVAGQLIPVGLVYKDGLLEKLNLKSRNL